MIKRLFNEFLKNVKIMFRNWTSLSLLIIAPLLMILLIGYSFSSENFTGIKIGIINDQMNTNETAVYSYLNGTYIPVEGKDYLRNISIDPIFLQKIRPLSDNISSIGDIIAYTDIFACVDDLITSKTHICVALQNIDLDDTSGSSIGTGKVTYYYDNSRKKVSLALIQKIQDYFGLKSEEISIEATEGIIENIQNLISFVNDRKQDITHVKNESVKIKKDLIEQKKQMIEVRDEFLPSYRTIKSLQKEINEYSTSIHNYSVKTTQYLDGSARKIIGEIDNITYRIDAANNITRKIDSAAGILDSITGNLSGIVNSSGILPGNTTRNITGTLNSYSMSSELKSIRATADSIKEQLFNVSWTINQTDAKIQNMTARINAIVTKIDLIKEMLDSQIEKSDEYITKIDLAITEIEKTEKSLDSKLESLGKIEKGYGEKLIRPISYEYRMALPDAKNIQLSFPFLSVMIIMFIAILFSNISTLMEIHNKAHQRNIIAPINDLIYFFGMLVTSTIIVFLQAMVLFLVAQLKFGVNVNAVFPEIALVTTLLILFFVLAGMVFAYLSKSVQSSILLTTFFALILFIFGNTIAPMESMPGPARIVTEYNPIVLGEFLLREIQLYQTPLWLIADKILILAAYCIVLISIAIYISKVKNSKAY